MSLKGESSLVKTDWNFPPANPMDLMKDWLTQAEKANISEAWGMTLSTIDEAGWPWNRVVLLKELGESSLIFGSSSISSKGRDIERNGKVAGSLWWRESIQQILFQGFAFVASAEKSDYLFDNRSRSAQAVSLLSQQSQILESDEDLRHKVEVLCHSKKLFSRPQTWNAYEVFPIKYEFWQGDASRLHKRLQYTLELPNVDLSQELNKSIFNRGKWVQERLQP
jgi:dihydrophenazinedicarboxylate synthase